jgi:hypothetical protein
MNKPQIQQPRRLLATALVGLALSTGCVEDLGDPGQPYAEVAAQVKAGPRTRPPSDCTKKNFVNAGITAVEALPYVGTPFAVLNSLIDFTSFFRSCDLTLEEVTKVAKKEANAAIIAFAKSQLKAIDKLIQDDQVINLAKLEARYTQVFTLMNALAEKSFETTAAVVAAATVAMTLEMMKLTVTYSSRKDYIKEARLLADETLPKLLANKKTQFNAYWDKSSIYQHYSYGVGGHYETYIVYPDGSHSKLVYLTYKKGWEEQRNAHLYNETIQLAAERKAASDALFANAPYQKFLNSLPAISNTAQSFRNIAFRRPTSQSSVTIPNNSNGGNAVDGQYDDRRTATTWNPYLPIGKPDYNPWWQVDLGLDDGRLIPIKQITVNFQKGTRRWRAMVELLNQEKKVVWSRRLDTTVGGPHYMNTASTAGRYVRVRLTDNDAYLSLSEVVVLPVRP